MKRKILTLISTIMIFIPWTIFIMRQYDWALESPGAEISIACYAVFMMFSGIFTILCYLKGNVKNSLMKICIVINSVYLAGGAAVLLLMAQTK